MQCPMCSHDKSSVVMTRPTDEGVYRRHRCGACGEVFISLEVVVAGAKAIPKHAELQTQMKVRHANRTA